MKYSFEPRRACHEAQHLHRLQPAHADDTWPPSRSAAPPSPRSPRPSASPSTTWEGGARPGPPRLAGQRARPGRRAVAGAWRRRRSSSARWCAAPRTATCRPPASPTTPSPAPSARRAGCTACSTRRCRPSTRVLDRYTLADLVRNPRALSRLLFVEGRGSMSPLSSSIQSRCAGRRRAAGRLRAVAAGLPALLPAGQQLSPRCRSRCGRCSSPAGCAAPYLHGPLWHAHEMLFGFTLAVIVGFLFTAGRNWSNQPTPTGAPLAALALLWVAARVLVLTPYGWAAAAANVAFPLAAAIALARAVRGRAQPAQLLLRRPAAAAGRGGAGACTCSMLGVLALPAWVGIQLALDVVLFIMAVMAGRVVPMFTNNGVPGAQATRQPRLEKAGAGLGAGAAGGRPAAAAGAAAGRRWRRWPPRRTWRAGCCGSRGRTLRTPLVWVLHAAYAVDPRAPGAARRGRAGLGAPPLATHALTVGAVGGLIIGMMTRTARGHTGAAAARRPRRRGLLRAGAGRRAGARGRAAAGAGTGPSARCCSRPRCGRPASGCMRCATAPVLTAPAPRRQARLTHGLRRVEAAAPGHGGAVGHRLRGTRPGFVPRRGLGTRPRGPHPAACRRHGAAAVGAGAGLACCA